MTNPKHTDTSRSGDLVERLREQAYTITHMEAADRIEALEAENERLRKMLPRMERVKGRDIDEWRSNLSPELYRAGDAVICWVNEGDEIAVSLARAALGEKQ